MVRTMNNRAARRWPLFLLLVAGLAATACAPLADRIGAAAPDAPTPEVSGVVEAPATESGIQPGFPAPGHLAVLADDGNLYLVERGRPPQAVTVDAGSLDDGATIIYNHPSWSPSGWLSYVRIEAQNPSDVHFDLLAEKPGVTPPQTLLSIDDAIYVYGAWSPVSCADSEPCSRFAYLVNDQNQLALHLVTLGEDGNIIAEDRVVGRAAPFYYSWSPDGSEMLWFRHDAELVVYNVDADEIVRRLDTQPGRFMTPAWSPVDSRFLVAARSDGANELAVIDGDIITPLGERYAGYAFFGWSPDGQRIAYTHGGDPLAPVIVVEADGTGRRVLDAVEDVVAFFWSPDGTKIAVVSLVPALEPMPMAGSASVRARLARQGKNPLDFEFQWSVIDVETGEAVMLARFLPTASQWYMFKYFAQYERSHSVWSPDSRYIVYADYEHQTNRNIVYLVDTEQPQSPPIKVMDGELGVFSFGE